MYTDKKTFETIYRNNIDDPYINKRAKYFVCICSFVVTYIGEDDYIYSEIKFKDESHI